MPGKGRLTANSVIAKNAFAEKLQTSFTEPWRDLKTINIPQLDDAETLLKDNSPLKTILYPVLARLSCLDHLNQSKATGADGVPAWLLKRFSSVISSTYCP